MDDSKLVQASMTIILNAGDARLKVTEALKSIEVFDFDDAKAKLKEAKAAIQIAHKAQTEAIQDETRGEVSEHSLLFTHAQDTLMTIYSELNIANRLVKIIASVDTRLNLLEDNNAK